MHPLIRFLIPVILGIQLSVFVLAAPPAEPSPFPPFSTPPVESATQHLPKLIKRVEAVYPTELRGSGKQDEVYVAFIVEKDGAVSHARVFFGRYVEFEKPAIDAVSQWKFTPGMDQGHVVRTRMTVPIRFEAEAAK